MLEEDRVIKSNSSLKKYYFIDETEIAARTDIRLILIKTLLLSIIYYTMI